ncbi:MAG: hypothetical protein COB67_10980 [SAR324 cluster bacterium]|uniref:Ig-like domain-containing protein n=1 Tax=SAR324 cluster bacterium TaxID=2024889 RepID=A0A2A4SVN3_9DELT|nr:MAG: hypothetical protein COB67_10980 [SAR324 cluster bacterium]
MKYIRRTTVGLLAAVLLPWSGYAQENPTPENHELGKKVYAAPDGKLFVWGKANIYLRFSTSPEEGAPSHLLKSQKVTDSGKSAKPFQLEGHGKHTITHPRDHKNLQKTEGEHIFHVFDDSRLPTTKISVTDAPMVVNGKNIIYGKPVMATLSFIDEDSGVQGGYYSLNGSAPVASKDALKFVEEGDYRLKFYAFDNVGNKSKISQRYYSLDFTSPESSYQIVGTHLDNILSPRASIKLKSKDNKAGVQDIFFRFPAKSKKVTYKKSISMKGFKDGAYSLVFGANDRVKNAEKNKTFDFYLDTIPPVADHRLIGDQYQGKKTTYVSGRTKVELSATDNKAGVRRIRYFLKSKRGDIYSEPFGLPQKNGPVNFSYQASDKVININKLKKQRVTVDISQPTMKINFVGEHYFSRKNHYIRKSTKISYSTADNLSGVKSFEYTLDDDALMASTSVFSIAVEGQHSIITKTMDNVNNERNNRFLLFVDEKAPELFPRFGVIPTEPGDAQGNNGIYPKKTRLYFSATDGQSGIKSIQYKINNGKLRDYKAALTFPKVGNYTIEVVGIDNVGNVAKQSINFRIRKY